MKTEYLVLILSFLGYLFIVFSSATPFMYDEGTYSLMIKELSDNPTIVMPTLTGVHVEWKPPLFFWI